MKTPVDIVKGKIVDIDQYGVVTIKCQYSDWRTLIRREYKECNVQMIDSRPLSNKQRRCCYKLIRAISDYTGMGVDTSKEWLKLKFLVEDLQTTADQMFSLSNAPMSLVCAFQKFLIDFILDWEIPCDFPLLDFVDDTESYVYSCLSRKKCCVCGRKADLHHCTHIGMGRDREEVIHEGMKALPLCREHHTECHKIGQQTFERKYHLNGGIPLDKALCKIYKLKRNEDEEYVEQMDWNGEIGSRPGVENNG